jgi:hypothetical protein
MGKLIGLILIVAVAYGWMGDPPPCPPDEFGR